MANRAAGKGYENENFYTNIKFQFLGIENIHVMRGSLQKMAEGNDATGILLKPKSVIETLKIWKAMDSNSRSPANTRPVIMC